MLTGAREDTPHAVSSLIPVAVNYMDSAVATDSENGGKNHQIVEIELETENHHDTKQQEETDHQRGKSQKRPAQRAIGNQNEKKYHNEGSCHHIRALLNHQIEHFRGHDRCACRVVGLSAPEPDLPYLILECDRLPSVRKPLHRIDDDKPADLPF